MAEIYFIDHYDSFSLNLVDWLTSLDPSIRVHYTAFDADDLYNTLIRKPKPIVFSPGPKSPREVEESKRILHKLLGVVPILGVCLGHQLLGETLGMKIQRSKAPIHGQLVKVVRYGSSELLTGMPEWFEAARYNSLVVVEGATLLPDTRVTSRSELGEIMSLEYRRAKDYPAFGIQFHPESFLMKDTSTPILRNWHRVVKEFYDDKFPRLESERTIL